MAAQPHPLKIALGCLLALIGCYCAYRSWDEARIAYLRGSDPSAALAARPTDAASLTRSLDRQMEQRADTPVSDRDMRLVHSAFADAPLSRGLLRIVGLKAESQGNRARADAAMALSNRISRRDPLAQLWLIEDSVGKDDMKGAVTHYNAALSVHPELGQVLFPILAKAIAFPEVRAALAPYIERQARWSVDMVKVAINRGNPADVAMLLIPVGEGIRGEAYEALNARLIARLAETGDFVMAARLAHAIDPKLDPRALASFQVNDVTTDKRLGALAWSLAEDGRILASPNGQGGFDVDVEPLTRGVAAARTVQVLPGKTYEFSQTVRVSSSGAMADMNWQVFCLPAQTKVPIWQQVVPKSQATQRYQATITVPVTCKGLAFALNARGPEGQQSAHAAFEALEFRPKFN